MSAANPNPMEKSMVSVLVVANAGGGSPLPCGVPGFLNFVFKCRFRHNLTVGCVYELI
jgi:hypothetical protein